MHNIVIRLKKILINFQVAYRIGYNFELLLTKFLHWVITTTWCTTPGLTCY